MIHVQFQLITKFSRLKSTPFKSAVPYSTLCLWCHQDKMAAKTWSEGLSRLNLFLTPTKFACGALPARQLPWYQATLVWMDNDACWKLILVAKPRWGLAFCFKNRVNSVIGKLGTRINLTSANYKTNGAHAGRFTYDSQRERRLPVLLRQLAWPRAMHSAFVNAHLKLIGTWRLRICFGRGVSG